MNILLTGGAGFIGSHTGVELLKAGHQVVVVDNLYNSSKASIARVEELTGKTVKFYEADACDGAALDKIFTENQIDQTYRVIRLRYLILNKLCVFFLLRFNYWFKQILLKQRDD